MNRAEKFLSELSNYKLSELKNRYVYRVSLKYYSRVLFLIAILLINLVYTVKNTEKLNNVVIVLLVLISAYVLFSFYSVFSYKLVIENDKLIYGKNIIDLKQVDSLKVGMNRVGGTKVDLCLSIISEKKKYIIRLNVGNNLEFVKLVSTISNVEVGA